MAAGQYDITCEQGATFLRTMKWLDENEAPIDLTGYSALMHVRTTHKATTTIVTLSTAQGTIVLEPSTGTIQLSLSATQTAALPTGKAVYDLELTSSGGVVTRLLEGKFVVTPEVTRA